MNKPAAAHGLARVLSKRGFCSRAEAQRLIEAGRVRIDGRVCRDPERRTALDSTNITVDGKPLDQVAGAHRYLMLNKPRGLVTTRSDEQGRATVYDCLRDAGEGWLAPVGRLDQASEGLLLFSSDSAWAAAVTGPESRLGKHYHVQIDRIADDALLARLRDGIDDAGEHLIADRVERLRTGDRNSWLAIVLSEGRNRQIRRMLAACDVAVLRLVRIAIGDLPLGQLGKGQWRWLTADEVAGLRNAAGSAT